jgi:hypothetical protein
MPQNVGGFKIMADLKELFGEEMFGKIDSIVKEKGLNIIVDNKENPNFIPKSRFDEVIGQKNQVKSQADELIKQLDELKKSVKGNEEFTKTIEELQKKNLDWEGKYKNTLLESAIKIKATTEKAKDAGDLIKFLDVSKLEIDDSGNVKGLEEQLKTLKESKSYLFDTGTNPNQTTNPAGTAHKTELQQLEEAYAQAIKTNNTVLQIMLKNKIFKLTKK